jgi:hypothetical protein
MFNKQGYDAGAEMIAARVLIANDWSLVRQVLSCLAGMFCPYLIYGGSFALIK